MHYAIYAIKPESPGGCWEIFCALLLDFEFLGYLGHLLDFVGSEVVVIPAFGEFFVAGFLEGFLDFAGIATMKGHIKRFPVGGATLGDVLHCLVIFGYNRLG